MDTSSPTRLLPELLTEENLLKLQRHPLSPSLTPSLSSRSPTPPPTPCERLGNAKRAVFDAMKSLWDLVRNRRHEDHHRRHVREILKTDELRITSTEHVRYARNRSNTPDLENPAYWETKRKYFEDIHRSYNELRNAKDWVYDTMRALERLGHTGRQAVREETELFIAGQNLVCYRGKQGRKQGRKPDLEDPMYWKAKLHELRAKYADIKRQTPPPPALVQPDQAKEWVYNIIRALENIGDKNKWAPRSGNLYIAGENDVRYRGEGPEPNFDDPAYWMIEVQNLGECYALQSRWDETRPTQEPVTLEQAKELVFNAMWALELNPEGRRILQDDEFYIAGWNDVQCRDHNRNHLNPAYWMDRLKYFSDKYDGISRWDSRRRDGRARVYDEIQRLLWDHGRSGLWLLLGDELYFDMAADAICYRGDNGYDVRYQGREPPDLEDPAYWERRLQDFKAKNEQARRKSLSNRVFTFGELDELDELEKARKAYDSQLRDGETGTVNRMEEEIQQWVDNLQGNDLQRPSSPASIPSSTVGSIWSCDDSNARGLSQDSLVNKPRFRDIGCWEAKAELFDGQLWDPTDCRISERECQTPSPPRTLNAVNPSAQHFVHGRGTATPRVQLRRSLKRKTCHLDVTVSITDRIDGPAEANLNNSSAGVPALKKVKHDCQKYQESPTQPPQLRRSARIAAKEGRMNSTPGLRQSARIAARRGRSPV